MPSSSRFLSGFAAFAAIVGLASAGCDHVIGGITYCHETDSITYNNIGFPGTYQDVTNMDSAACTCSFAPKAFSGGMAPLNEELSMHFRGPLELKQFAVYSPNPKKKKRTEEHIRRHANAHKRDPRVALKTVTTTITTTIYPSETSTVATAPGSTAPSSTPGHDDDEEVVEGETNGDWSRIASYNAEKGTADGLVFLNLMGGQGSGVWDDCFGNSISYANSNADGGAASPQILKNIKIPSNKEFMIMSDKECVGDSCGYYQPGIPAYHGFGGQDKVFLFEFRMPKETAQDISPFNLNLGAIWALNAKIPRTAQYGKSPKGDGRNTCSCWDSGCGEIDLFETLLGGDDYLKTHYHSKQGAVGGYGGGGAVDYFPRPYHDFIQAAVVFSGKQVSITILDKKVNFTKTLNKGFINSCKKDVSVFTVPS